MVAGSNSRAAKIDEERLDTIKSQRQVIRFCLLIMGLLIGGLVFSFSVRPIWVAPDLSTGQKITANSPYRSYPYTFVYRHLDSIWNWSEDGEKEYRFKIKGMKELGYIGTEMIGVYEKERKTLSNRRVLEGRTRKVKEFIPNNVLDMVQPLSGERFVVFIDAEVTDRLNGSVVSIQRRRYSFIVDVNTSDMEKNPYGLIVQGYYKPPELLNPTNK